MARFVYSLSVKGGHVPDPAGYLPAASGAARKIIETKVGWDIFGIMQEYKWKSEQ